MARILVVDDQRDVVRVLNTVLASSGHAVVSSEQGEEVLSLLERESFDLMISDICMTPVDGMTLLESARRMAPDMPVILITAYATVETAVRALKLKVFDYMRKPLKVDDLIGTVERALDYGAFMLGKGEGDADLRYGLPGVVAASDSMVETCATVKKSTMSDLPVMLVGEYGVGKKTVAASLHAFSVRHKSEFEAISCAEMPEPILELLLSAKLDDHKFLNRSALGDPVESIGGTLYLGDIECMPVDLQVRLAAVLDVRGVPVDAEGGLQVGSRIVAGTTGDVDALVAGGEISGDLRQKLASLRINLPPLRERTQDIIPLALHFLRKNLGEAGSSAGMAGDAREALEEHSWSGNAAELELVMGHAAAASKGGVVQFSHLPECVTSKSDISSPEERHLRGKALKEFLRQRIAGAKDRWQADR